MNRDPRPLRERLADPHPGGVGVGGQGAENPPADGAPAGSDGSLATGAQHESVKRVTLGQIIDTFQSESELNGWKPTQGRML